jgi:WD40 repeat protein
VRIGAAPLAVAFTPDGTRVVVRSADGSLARYDLATGARVAIANEPAGIERFSVAPDGRVAWVAHDVVSLWDERTGNRPLGALGGPSSGLAFSSDGSRLAAATSTPIAIVWQLDGDRSWRLPHADPVRAVMFASPDVLVTGTENGVVTYWNLADGSRHIYRRGSGYVITLANAGSGRVASGGSDPEIDLWAMPSDWTPAAPAAWLSTITDATLPDHLRPQL